MKSILIKKINNIIYLSTTNLNNYNDKTILIDYDFFLENNNILISYINKITNNNKVYTLNISNTKLFDDIISIIHRFKYITILIINTKKLIDNKYIYKLIDCNNIKVIKCYEINSNLFNSIDENKKLFITTLLNYNSYFYKLNNIMTSSLIYYKKYIKINDKCNIEDIKYFISINKYLEKIDLYYINYKIINNIVDLLIENNRHNILIDLNINENNVGVLNENIKQLKQLEKEKCSKYDIDIRSNYSNKYKGKFYIKELNNTYLRTSMLVISIIVIISFCIITYYEYSTNKIINDVQNISGILDMLDNSEDIIINSNEENNNVSDDASNQDNNNNNISSNTGKVLTYDFNKLLEINSEFVGWLKVNNTKVNYPVVKHSDNDYYLNRNFYKNVSNAGWVFMDYRNDIDILDQNTIIYGHSNTINSTMFGSLYNVLDEKWYTNKENHIITFNSLYEEMKFEIFAIYITDPEYYYIWTSFYNNVDRFNTFISETAQKSIYDFDVDVNIDDKILTLSTCYNRGTQRIAIHAKKL